MSDDLLVKGFTIKLKEFIGQGAYGVVYRAVDSTGKAVAVTRIDLGGKHSLPNIIEDGSFLRTNCI